jgi:hypothetical protein
VEYRVNNSLVRIGLTFKGSKESENCGENDDRRTNPRPGRFRDRTGDWLEQLLNAQQILRVHLDPLPFHFASSATLFILGRRSPMSSKLNWTNIVRAKEHTGAVAVHAARVSRKLLPNQGKVRDAVPTGAGMWSRGFTAKWLPAKNSPTAAQKLVVKVCRNREAVASCAGVLINALLESVYAWSVTSRDDRIERQCCGIGARTGE